MVLDRNETNIAKNWVLKVRDQKKSKDGNSVILDCFSSGRKRQDGSYESGMFVSVVATEDTEWKPASKVGSYIDVTGQFAHREYLSEKTGKTSLGFTIFATEINDHEFEAKNVKTENEGW